MPFCRRLCPYCDFAVAVRPDPPHEAYADALIAEWKHRRELLDGRQVRTVYFGGGTPAMWADGAMARFVDTLRSDPDLFLGDVTETTLEANPHDVERSKLDHWSSLGFDRLSIGVQSFDDRYLRALGRDHDGTTAHRAVEQAMRDGRFRVGMDLIFDGPGYNIAVADADAAAVTRLRPNHVSAYELTVEPSTVFARRHAAGDLDLPDEDSPLGEELRARLAASGFERYEVSNLGRGGDYSQHNTAYWSGWEYLGLGVGAHSFWFGEAGPRRRANRRNLRDYLEDPLQGGEEEALTPLEHFGERLFLAARTRRSPGWEKLRHQFRDTVPDEAFSRVERVIEEVLVPRQLWQRLPTFGPTAKGLSFADWIGGQFWDALGERGAL